MQSNNDINIGNSFLGIFSGPNRWEATKNTGSWVVEKVCLVVKIAFIAIASVFLFLANPTLFAVGIVVGLVFSSKVRDTVEQVKQACVDKPWLAVIVAGGVGVGAFLALPVTIAVGSFTCGAYLSSKWMDVAGVGNNNRNVPIQ